MTFVGIAVIWGGYTLAWWGWLAMTNRVAPPAGATGGDTKATWWPSISDLIVPAKASNVPTTPRLSATQQLEQQSNADLNTVPIPGGGGTGVA